MKTSLGYIFEQRYLLKFLTSLQITFFEIYPRPKASQRHLLGIETQKALVDRGQGYEDLDNLQRTLQVIQTLTNASQMYCQTNCIKYIQIFLEERLFVMVGLLQHGSLYQLNDISFFLQPLSSFHKHKTYINSQHMYCT